jgi:hypothetical protein
MAVVRARLTESERAGGQFDRVRHAPDHAKVPDDGDSAMSLGDPTDR